MTEQQAGSLHVTGTVQREAWLERVSPPIEQLASDLFSIPVPIPNSPLRYVSVYVLAGDSSLTLIDAGWNSDESWTMLCAGLESIGASVADVSGCLVTHQHMDHIGLAGRVQEASGSWVGLHEADRDAIARPTYRDPTLAKAADAEWLRSLGAPESVGTVIHPGGIDPRSQIPVPDRTIADGEDLKLPGWSLRAVHTPGHTPGHLCFVAESRGLLFSGDHVLPRITPNISADRDRNVDALGDFLRSLSKIEAEQVDEVLPAHEWRFAELAKRTRQIAAHHEDRLEELLAVVQNHPGLVAWELAGRLTWSRSWDQYDGYMRISAVAETMAHLRHLMTRNLILASDEPVSRYRAVSG